MIAPLPCKFRSQICWAVQLLLADRLIEARDEALNGHVFRVVLNENQTQLTGEPDLVPLTRRNGRSGIADGIAVSTAPRMDHCTLHAQALGVSLTRLASGEGTQLDSGGKCLSDEGDPGSSPRICAQDSAGITPTEHIAREARAAGVVNPVGAVRRRFYGRDGEDVYRRVVSMHSGLLVSGL